MEQGPSGQTTVFSHNEIPCILCNPKVHYLVHNSVPFPPSWTKSMQSTLHPIYTLILSSHLRLGPPSGLFPSDFSTKPCMHLCSPTCVLHATSISFSIWSPEQYCVRSTDNDEDSRRLRFSNFKTVGTWRW